MYKHDFYNVIVCVACARIICDHDVYVLHATIACAISGSQVLFHSLVHYSVQIMEYERMAAPGLSDAFIEGKMVDWRMPGTMRAECIHWCQHVFQNGYFAKSFLLPVSRDGASGVLFAISTSETCRMSKVNFDLQQSGRIIDNPEWLHMPVWWFRGMSVMNFCFLDSEYQGHELPETFGQILEGMCREKSVLGWPEQYCRIEGGHYLASLRDLLPELGIANWVEVTSGHSWHAFRGLDVYFRFWARGMVPPAHEAWWIVNCHDEHARRWVVSAEDWYIFRTMTCMGQRLVVDEWVLMPPGKVDQIVADYRLRQGWALVDVWTLVEEDLDQFFKLLCIMAPRVGFGVNDPRMGPLIEAIAKLEGIKKVPRAIEDVSMRAVFHKKPPSGL